MIPPSVSPPCSRIRVLAVTTGSKITGRLSGTSRGSGDDQGSFHRTKRGPRGGVNEDLIAEAIGHKGRHRMVDRRGKARPCRALDFMVELSPKVKSVTNAILSYLELMCISSAGHVLQQMFLTKLKAVGRRANFGCSSHVCASPNRDWFREDALVLALSQRVEKDELQYPKATTSFCNLVRTCVSAHKKKTMEDGSHGDDPAGALPSVFGEPASFCAQCARAPALGTEPAPCISSGPQQNRTYRRGVLPS